MLQLLRYVTSFIDGRVRLRHPALHRHDVVMEIQPRILAIKGIQAVQFNERAGSLLLQYDPAVLSREVLIREAVPWAAYLDERLKGHPVTPPAVSGESRPVSPRHGRSCWRKTVNRGMLASLAVTVGALALNGQRVHAVAGTLFLAFAGVHIYRFRRSL